jgi:hypothetical protein
LGVRLGLSQFALDAPKRLAKIGAGCAAILEVGIQHALNFHYVLPNASSYRRASGLERFVERMAASFFGF